MTLYPPGSALVRWRAVTWPAQIVDANAEGRSLPPGSRWTTCRLCVRAPDDPACTACTLDVGADGLTRPDGWAEGKPSPEVSDRRVMMWKKWKKRARRNEWHRPRKLGRST